MKKTIQSVLTILAISLASTMVFAQQSAVGVWQSESSDRGYLHISIEPCEDKLCGKILMAYDLEDAENNTYEHIGKNMVWDMKSSGESSWKGGKIWDPTSDKTYKSKMSLNGDILEVSGCVLMFCKGQKWKRVP